jgi:hypothetical protein
MATAPNDLAYSMEAPAPAEVAVLWQFDVETIRKLFQDEPGVVALQSPIKKGRRPYKTIRIPQSVLDRVHKRLQR